MFDQLKNMKQLAGLMGNLGEVRERMERMQAELGDKVVEAESGAGAVRVVMNGRFEVVSLKIDSAMVVTLAGSGTEADNVMVEELIVSALNAAVARVQAMLKETLGEAAGGLGLPGL